MTIVLPPDLQKLVDDKIRDGPYATTEDVVRAALTQFFLQDDDFEPGELDELLAAGTAAIEHRQVHAGDDVFDEIRTLSDERRRGQQP